jgi:hypothetical protein
MQKRTINNLEFTIHPLNSNKIRKFKNHEINR